MSEEHICYKVAALAIKVYSKPYLVESGVSGQGEGMAVLRILSALDHKSPHHQSHTHFNTLKRSFNSVSLLCYGVYELKVTDSA